MKNESAHVMRSRCALVSASVRLAIAGRESSASSTTSVRRWMSLGQFANTSSTITRIGMPGRL